LDIWKSVKNGDYNDGFAARPEYNRDDLRSWDYNPNMRIFFHGDAHEGTLAHNSFRFAQSLVRKWGTIILWLENSFINNAPAEIGMRIRNGLLELMESRYAESSSTPAWAKKKPIALKQPK
jgi:hypothetical protein